ncbi:MAG TPA: AAA family ATPase [Gaiellales bacterium]|jgi:DNA-binding CsgD family transcriptional regulator/tetratricopeptide (TPR) repeat protein
MVEPDGLIGRGDELALIEVFLDERGPRGLLIEGEPGIGKSSLWASGVEASRGRGMTILAARATGAEVRLSYAGLSDMVGDLPASAFASLPEPQQRALDAALLRVNAPRNSAGARAVGQALLGVLRAVAAESPAVVAVDDLQWLDAPSGRALNFALRRLVDEPVALLATARTEAYASPPIGLDRVFMDGRLRRVRVCPLGERAIERIVQARLGPTLSRRAIARLHERAGGNPFFALEMSRLLEGGRIEAADELPLPESLRELVHERLGRLPARTRRVLLAAAAMSEPRVELLGRTVAADLRPALEDSIVQVDGGVIRFAHPLLAFVPYEEATDAERRRLHSRLARVVSDPEERARHLALAASGPDERVAAELDRAAGRALARGAPDAAAELAHLARRLTPGWDAERLLAEAEYTFESGDSVRARALMEEAVGRLEPGPRRAHAIARPAWFRGGWGDDPYGALALLDGAVEQAGGDLAVAAEVFECLTWQCQLVGRHDDAARYARRGADAAERLGEPRWTLLLALATALAEGKLGRARAARAAVARLVQQIGGVADVRAINDPAWLRALFHASDGDLESALSLTRRLHERALELGDESSLPNLLEHLGLLEFRAGNWQRADELIDMALEVARRTDQQIQCLAVRPWRAFIDAHLGRIESARAIAADTIAEARERGLPVYQDAAHWALVRLELSNDDPGAALTHFLRLQNAGRGIGEHSFFRHYGDASEALAAVGDLDAAATMVRRWRAHATALDRAMAGPGGDRCGGLIAVAGGDVERGVPLLERAVARGRRLAEPFELARSLLALGTAQRRARRKRMAATTLREAIELFEQLPAPLWAMRARSELARIGGRRVTDSALTETERRIVVLVAGGRSNAEVGRELSVSTKTVEWNLSKAYRKLGVRSRSELAARAAGQIEGFPRLVASRR